MNKVFIIGLPRTGTTSACVALLEHGFKVAHTAYTQQSFALADVVADTPCYADYPQLDELFPGSKFIYSERKLDTWVPSMQMLLTKITKYLAPDGHFNPVIKRCFKDTFQLDQVNNPRSEIHLRHCYEQHRQNIESYFAGRNDLLCLDVSQAGNLTTLLQFLGRACPTDLNFPMVNTGRMITAWKDIKHPNKVGSSEYGPKRRKFFDY